MDESDLLDVIGVEGAEVGIRAVGGHSYVLQRGGEAYLYHNRGVSKLIPGKAELDEIAGQKFLYGGGHPYRSPVFLLTGQKIIKIRYSCRDSSHRYIF